MADHIARDRKMVDRPMIPDGWQIERRPDGTIIVRADGISGAAVSRYAAQARQIPEEILWHLCDALLIMT